MYDSVAMYVVEAVQDLPKQAPGSIYIIIQAVSYQVAQSLESSISKLLVAETPPMQPQCICATHMFLTVLHLYV